MLSSTAMADSREQNRSGGGKGIDVLCAEHRTLWATRAWSDAAQIRDLIGGRTVRIVRAISIRQPYAEQILRRLKRVECRSRSTRIRERAWIYASERPADDPTAWRSVRKKPGELPTGVIVGSAVIVNVRGRANRDFAYKLAAPKRVSNPKRPWNQPRPVFWRPKF